MLSAGHAAIYSPSAELSVIAQPQSACHMPSEWTADAAKMAQDRLQV
jgi:hypothetical protein